MTIKVLLSPHSIAPAATLIPDKEVEIFESFMKEDLERGGITVDKQFREKYHTGRKVYPSDDKAIFAKAFEQFYFIHGLQQQRYKWAGPEALERFKWAKFTDEEKAKHLVKVYMESLKNKTPPSETEDTAQSKKRKIAEPDPDKQQTDSLNGSS